MWRNLMQRPLLAGALVFLLAAIAAASLIWIFEQREIETRRARVTSTLTARAAILKRRIDDGISATYALAALVRRGKGEITDFDAVAGEMLRYYPGVSELALAPAGVIRQVAPLAENEKALGFNLLTDPRQKKEALIARDTQAFTLAGPLELVQGGVGVVGRLPVFLDDAQGKPAFWGFVLAVMRLPTVLKSVDLPELAEQGLAYELWRINPDTAQKQVIVASAGAAPVDPVQTSLQVPNASWTFSLAPAEGWRNVQAFWLNAGLGLLISALLAFLAKSLLELRMHRTGLEALVARRTDELRAREKHYRELFEANPQPMWVYDLETLKFLAVNDAVVAHYGYSREEFLAMRIPDIRPPEEVPRLLQRVAEIRTTDKHKAGVWRHRKKDGSLIDVEITSHTLEFDGRRAQIVHLDDITDRLRAERALRESEARFRSLTEISSDFFWESDAEHRLTQMVTGSKEDPAIILPGGSPLGKPRWEVPYLTPDAAGWEAHRAGLDAHRPFRDFEYSRMAVDARVRHIAISGDPVFDASGVFQGYRGVGKDISERKAAEAKIARLSQLYAALSQCNQAIVRSASADELFPQICRDAVQFGGMKSARISMVDPEARMMRVAANFAYGDENLQDLEVSIDGDSPYGRGPTGIAVRENRPVWCQDFMNDPMTAPWHARGASLGWGSMAALPLHRFGAVVGAFVLFDAETHAFDAERRELLVEMARDISFALDNFESEARRQKVEEALRESEARFRSLTEMSSDFYWETDAEHRLTQRSVGSRRNALIEPVHDAWRGLRRWEIPYLAPDAAGWREHRAALDAHLPFRDFEFSRAGADGSTRYFLVHGDPVFDAAGEFCGYRGVGSDITERKRAELALRESEQRLRLAMTSAAMAAWEWDIGSDVLAWGDHPGWLLGPEPADGYPDFRKLVHPEDRAAFLDAGRQAIAQGTHYHAVFRIVRTDAVVRWVEAEGVFFEAAGTQKRERVIGVSRDITESKNRQDELRRLNEELEQRVAERTQALEAANAELEAFSYSVSHDLRAPLRTILGFGRMLEEQFAGQVDAEAREMLGRVSANAEKMGRLIDDLLKLSRVSRQALQVEQVDLSALAREAADALQAEQPQRRVEWVIAPQAQALGDPGLLRVVLQNLIGNAWKYSSRREVARIEFGVSDAEGPVTYFVRDNGAGFDMAQANKLFGPFQRLHTEAEFPGSGIGLATVARILLRHGGRVWAEARPGEGAVFHFSLD